MAPLDVPAAASQPNREAWNKQPALSLKKVSKQYVGTKALDRVDVDLWRGQIHAILGENGAGKSTLIKIITGVIQRSAGDITADGRPVEIGTPQNAANLGITSVPQDVLLVPELQIGRNILLGLESRPFFNTGSLSADEHQKVSEALSLVGAKFSPSTPTRNLSVPELRLAQIARALVQPGDILVLDEPTAVLAEPDADLLLEKLMGLRAAGKAIVYITHRLSEVIQIADQATILRDGLRVGTINRPDFARAKFVNLMAKEVTTARPLKSTTQRRDVSSPPVLTVKNISVGTKFQGVDLSVSRGQIVGIAGVQGSGHGHVLRAIAGVNKIDSGEITLFDKPVRPGKVVDTFRKGVRLVPADRRGAGILPQLTNGENVILSPDAELSVRPMGFRAIKKEQEQAKHYIDLMDVRPPDPHKPTGTLSGGNQQKVVLGRALSKNADVLLVEEPTQGIDVRSRAEIHELLRETAQVDNRAILIASSEFEELIGLADVIHVMRLGKLVATLPGEGTTYRDVLDHALS